MKLIKENMLLEKRWLKTIDGKVAKRFHQVLDNDDSQNAPQALKDLLDKILEVEPQFKEDYDNLMDELSALGSVEDYDNEGEFDSQFNYIVDLMYDYCDEHNIWIDTIYDDSDEDNKNEIDLDEALGLKENNNLSDNNHINEDFDMDKFIEEHDDSFKYQLLDRMKGDCEYYIANRENDENNHLWGKNAKDHIEYMKKIYNSFDEKPEWLTMQDIENFEKRMLGNEKIIDESISEAEKKRLMKEIKSMAKDDYEVGHPQDPDDFREFAHMMIDDTPELGYYDIDEEEVVITDETTMHELWDYYWECLDELRGTLYESIDNPYSLKLSQSERSTAIKLAKEGINKLDPEKEYSEQELFNAMDPENNYEEEEYFWYAMYYLLDKGSLITTNGKYKKAPLDEAVTGKTYHINWIDGNAAASRGTEPDHAVTSSLTATSDDEAIKYAYLLRCVSETDSISDLSEIMDLLSDYGYEDDEIHDLLNMSDYKKALDELNYDGIDGGEPWIHSIVDASGNVIYEEDSPEYYDEISSEDEDDDFEDEDDDFEDDDLDEKLIQSASKEALQKNIETEIEAGKDPKQAAAIAYSVKEKNEDLTQDILQDLKDRDKQFYLDKEAERQAKVELAKNGIETDSLNEDDDFGSTDGWNI